MKQNNYTKLWGILLIKFENRNGPPNPKSNFLWMFMVGQHFFQVAQQMPNKLQIWFQQLSTAGCNTNTELGTPASMVFLLSTRELNLGKTISYRKSGKSRKIADLGSRVSGDHFYCKFSEKISPFRINNFKDSFSESPKTLNFRGFRT